MPDLLDKVAPAKSISADTIRVMLRDRFPPDEYALLYEVRDATGFSARRSADALAVSLWPSRGLSIIGYEIKVARSDWVKELANPEKAESIARFCDQWYLVVSDASIVHMAELPAAWGLIAVVNGKLRVLKEAPKLEPQPLSRLFVAAICRAAQKASASDAQIKAAVAENEKRHQEQRTRELEQARKERHSQYESLRQAVDAFEKSSGIHISNWNGGRIGEAVKVVMTGGLDQHARTIRSLLQQIGPLHDGLKALTELLPKEEF